MSDSQIIEDPSNHLLAAILTTERSIAGIISQKDHELMNVIQAANMAHQNILSFEALITILYSVFARRNVISTDEIVQFDFKHANTPENMES